MTANEQRVWLLLSSHHRGHRRGVRTEALARELKMSRRHLREIIATLVLEWDKPIGSHPDWGTFVLDSDEDAHLADQCLRREALPTLQRRSRMRRAWKRVKAARQGELVKQGEMFDEGI